MKSQKKSVMGGVAVGFINDAFYFVGSASL